MPSPTNDWERRYQAAIACPECGTIDVHKADCPVLRRRWRTFSRIRLAALVVILVGVAFFHLGVGALVAPLIGGFVGSWFAARWIRRTRQSS